MKDISITAKEGMTVSGAQDVKTGNISVKVSPSARAVETN